jgi:diguanylate cyclase (GGDEF)-like protein
VFFRGRFNRFPANGRKIISNGSRLPADNEAGVNPDPAGASYPQASCKPARNRRGKALLNITDNKGVIRRLYETSSKCEKGRDEQARGPQLTESDGPGQIASPQSFFDQFPSYLRHTQQQGEPLSIILFDLDGFNGGGDCRDHALLEAAKKIAGLARSTDLLARHCGEKFILLLPDTAFEETMLAAQRLREGVNAIDYPERPLRCGFGITSFVPPDAPINNFEFLSRRLVVEAETALRHSKIPGRGCISHYAMIIHPSGETRSA